MHPVTQLDRFEKRVESSQECQCTLDRIFVLGVVTSGQRSTPTVFEALGRGLWVCHVEMSPPTQSHGINIFSESFDRANFALASESRTEIRIEQRRHSQIK
mmetsp:Transcript_23257/g.34459  ORF Transcript_23257/g.34459 Transcript_23257/m.34459 type:complete len:101 (-) Transcript_23257:1209-1511(-)